MNNRAEMPKRIQMHRRKGGWRKEHPDAVIVARPTKWGNPFKAASMLECGYAKDKADAQQQVDDIFRGFMAGSDEFLWGGGEELRAKMLAELHELRGKDLACWCPLDQPCHADVLLELANRPLEACK